MDQNSDWSDALRNSIGDHTADVSEDLWGRIEGSLDSQRPMYIGKKGVAAVILSLTAVAAMLAIIFLGEEQVKSDIMEQVKTPMVAAQNHNEIEIEQVVAEQPSLPTVAHVKTKTIKAPEQPIKQIIEIAPQQPQKESIAQEKTVEEVVNNSKIHYDKIKVVRSPRRSTLSLLYAGGLSRGSTSAASTTLHMMISERLTSGVSPTQINPMDIYNSSDISHLQPLGFGLKLQHELSRRLHIGYGMNYSLLRSNVYMNGDGEPINQQLHFLGIPAQLNYRLIGNDNYTIYLSAGGSVEYCLRARVGSMIFDERRWHYSTSLNLGAEYHINRWLGLYLEPSISHYFTQSRLRSIRNDSPTTFNINMGFSFRL